MLTLSPKFSILNSALWCWDLDSVNHAFPLLAGFLLGSPSGVLVFRHYPAHFCTLVVAVCFVLSLTSVTALSPSLRDTNTSWLVTLSQRSESHLCGYLTPSSWHKHQLGKTFSSELHECLFAKLLGCDNLNLFPLFRHGNCFLNFFIFVLP